MTDTWNPDQYAKFLAEREQPFYDLLAMIQPAPQMRIVDLGCGMGRLTTMLQMVGVLVLALGIPQVFSSIAEGRHVDNRALVAGYVVMRVAMVIQWLRAASQDPGRKAACLTYATAITVATWPLLIGSKAWTALMKGAIHKPRSVATMA